MERFYILLTAAALLLSCGHNKKEMRKASYSGDDISGDAVVIRDKETKKTVLDIKAGENWVLYAGTQVNNIDFSRPVISGNSPGTYSIDVPDSVRSYFLLETDKGSAIIADKHLPMRGGYNFRDMGGYRTTDGKYVKWGK